MACPMLDSEPMRCDTFDMVGVDEVGRGAWAGPLLVVAAKQTGPLAGGVKDSKLLSRAQREKILDKLSNSCEFGEGWVSAAEIDSIGLSRSLSLGASRALAMLKVIFDDEILLDGKFNYLPGKFTSAKAVVKADTDYKIVSAASIYAKVKRDRFMFKLSKDYPNYRFENHVGYGTKSHRDAIAKFGAIKGVHRFCFRPILEAGAL